MSRRPKPYIYCADGDGVNPISPRLIIGERRIGAAEAPEEGEAPGEAEAPGEGPPEALSLPWLILFNQLH